MSQQPILSAPDQTELLDLGGHTAIHRIKSEDTNSVFSVLEMIVQPGEGADVHTHSNEDELVHVLEGEVEVTLGDQTMTAPAGVVALLPRGIPHGYRNKGATVCRIMDVILPGGADRFFAGLSELIASNNASPENLQKLMREFGVR
ncbi:MAG: cupin domain-containing protein [Planctomycetota bacterium]